MNHSKITKLFLTLVAAGILCGVSALAETATMAKEASHQAEGFKLIHADELQKEMTASPNAIHVFDANNDSTRKTEGVIPGAVILANSSQYDTVKVLPADKKAQVVFYCANTECMASHTAAKRAVTAGYQNVSVMSDGIQGWKKAGFKTSSL